MSRVIKAFVALGVLSAIGLAACEEEDNVLEIETPDGELEIEEDGDINIEER